jgi:hypothetical protein
MPRRIKKLSAEPALPFAAAGFGLFFDAVFALTLLQSATALQQGLLSVYQTVLVLMVVWPLWLATTHFSALLDESTATTAAPTPHPSSGVRMPLLSGSSGSLAGAAAAAADPASPPPESPSPSSSSWLWSCLSSSVTSTGVVRVLEALLTLCLLGIGAHGQDFTSDRTGAGAGAGDTSTSALAADSTDARMLFGSLMTFRLVLCVAYLHRSCQAPAHRTAFLSTAAFQLAMAAVWALIAFGLAGPRSHAQAPIPLSAIERMPVTGAVATSKEESDSDGGGGAGGEDLPMVSRLHALMAASLLPLLQSLLTAFSLPRATRPPVVLGWVVHRFGCLLMIMLPVALAHTVFKLDHTRITVTNSRNPLPLARTPSLTPALCSALVTVCPIAARRLVVVRERDISVFIFGEIAVRRHRTALLPPPPPLRCSRRAYTAFECQRVGGTVGLGLCQRDGQWTGAERVAVERARCCAVASEALLIASAAVPIGSSRSAAVAAAAGGRH